MAEIDPSRRIVVTGMGTVNPLGLDVKTSWANIIAGYSGIIVIEPPELAIPDVRIAGQVKGFDPKPYIPPKEIRNIHPSAQFAYVAALEALQDAGLVDLTNLLTPKLLANPNRTGLALGSGIGGGMYIAEIEDTLRDKGPNRVRTTAMLQLLPERSNSITSILLGIKGPISAIVAACATGSESIINAIYRIREKDADVMVTGGTEAAISPVGLASFNALRALSTHHQENPTEASRFADEEADGFVMAEGAGVLVLESAEHAQRRGAKIYAEIVGYGDTADAHDDVAPSGEGAVRALKLALGKSGIYPREVDYINAHGTSTPSGDPVELEAIAEVFGRNNPRLSISSTKSAVGHMLGAAGGFEAIMCIKAIEAGIVPPTLNLRNPIKEAEGLDLVPLKAKVKPVDVAISNSFGFGGINSVLVFKRFEP